MVMNNRKQNNIFGVVEKTEKDNNYTGVKTKTANVTVDNVDRKISVDVDLSSILGENSNSAYPGHLGVQARRLALNALEAVEMEQARAEKAEESISEEIRDLIWEFEVGDNEIRAELNAEKARAITAEQLLSDSIDTVKNDYADKQYVEQKIIEYNKLSKRLADYIDVDRNIVVIEGVEQAPIENVVYLVKDYTNTGEVTYKQYTTIDGKLTLVGNTNIDLTDYSTIKYVDAEVDKVEKKLDNYAKKSDIPDVSSFISSIPSEYITEEELDAKKYLTEHQDLSEYATKSYVQTEISKVGKLAKKVVDAVDLENNNYIIDDVVYSADADVIYLVLDNSNGVYNQFTLIDDNLKFIGSTDVDLRGYATEEYVDAAIAQIPEIDLTPYAKTEQIPTKLSQLSNDANYAKKSDIPDVSSFIEEIPEEYVTEGELLNKGYYTQPALIKFLNDINFIDGGTSTQIYK